jgi:hypothetical protein
VFTDLAGEDTGSVAMRTEKSELGSSRSSTITFLAVFPGGHLPTKKVSANARRSTDDASRQEFHSRITRQWCTEEGN